MIVFSTNGLNYGEWVRVEDFECLMKLGLINSSDKRKWKQALIKHVLGQWADDNQAPRKSLSECFAFVRIPFTSWFRLNPVFRAFIISKQLNFAMPIIFSFNPNHFDYQKILEAFATWLSAKEGLEETCGLSVSTLQIAHQ